MVQQHLLGTKFAMDVIFLFYLTLLLILTRYIEVFTVNFLQEIAWYLNLLELIQGKEGGKNVTSFEKGS